MNAEDLARAFNEWLRRYTENPAGFEAEFQTVGRFLQERADGQEPSYGEQCAAYLLTLVGDKAATDQSGPFFPHR
jgi:hypothetical protein